MNEINRGCLYDLRTRRITEDLKAIKLLVDKYDDVLEVGSGTGRILKYLAQTHRRLTGIEKDYIMYTTAKQECEPYKNITLIHNDFLAYDGGRNFSCVLFAFNVFTEFVDVSLRFAVIEQAKKLLMPNGRVIIINDLPVFSNWHKNEIRHNFTLSDAGLGTWQCTINCVRNYINQTSTCDVLYSNVEKRHPDVTDRYTRSLLTRNELLTLYKATNCEVENEYGSYGLSSMEANSKIVIHVLRVN